MLSNEEFAAKFIRAVSELDEEPFTVSWMHEVHQSSEPAASGLGDCARQQWYKLTNAPITNLDRTGSQWSAFMGHLGQALAVRILEKMGYTILDQEKEVRVGTIVGHIDGIITGLDLEDRRMVYDAKVRNVYRLIDVLTKGVEVAELSTFLQMQAYMLAEGLDSTMLTYMPHDLSATRRIGWYQRKLAEKGWPEPVVNRVFVDADDFAQKLATDRSDLLTVAAQNDIMPAREFDPNDPDDAKFPCGYCPFMALCMRHGQSDGLTIPEIPVEWRE